jgi:integrase
LSQIIKEKNMASVRQRGNSFLASVRRNGIAENKSFPISAYATAKDPKAAAEAAANLWAAQTESNVLAEKHKQIPDKTFTDVLTRYLRDVTPNKPSAEGEAKKINFLLKDPIAQVHLRDLDSTHFVEWRDRRLKTIKPGSLLREWSLLSNVFSRAIKEWKWLAINPIKDVQKPASPDSRDRIPTTNELEAMKHCSGYDEGPITTKTAMTMAAFLFSCETSLRAGELCALEWNEVLLDKGYLKVTGIKPGARKNKAAVRDIPLVPRAKELLQQIMLTHSEGLVFQTNSASLDALFRKVTKRAAIRDLHFHDSRHVAITMLSKRYNVLALAKMVGHSNINELMTYYSAQIDDLVKLAA